jgi:hypothetical protein
MHQIILTAMPPKSPTPRRRYFKTMLALGSASALPIRAQPVPRDILYAGASFRSAEHAAQQHCLTRFEPASGERQLIASPFFPHALARSPIAPEKCLAFEKIGPGAALFNIQTGSLLAQIAPRSGKLFYGHGAFSLDGRLIYCTESALDGLTGSIGVFDAQTLKPIGEIASFGIRPHDLQLSKDGRVIMVTNGGGAQADTEPGSLCWIDARTGKLLRRLIVQNERMNAGHFQANNSLAVVVSAPRAGLSASDLGGIHLNTQPNMQSGELTYVALPEHLTKRLVGESLSLLIVPERRRFYVTHPGPGLVSTWDLDHLVLRQVFELPKARGLALSHDRNTLFVSHDAQAHLSAITLLPKGQDDLKGKSQQNTLLAGSHLFNWPQT